MFFSRKYILFLSFNLILCAIQTSEFNVKGMMCSNGCVKTIEKEINSIEGIKEYSISFEKSNMIITYDSELINDNDIMKKLNANTNKNNTSAIPKTYIEIKRKISLTVGFNPVSIITASEDAQGNIPVKIPTVIGFSIFVSINSPWECPQSSE